MIRTFTFAAVAALGLAACQPAADPAETVTPVSPPFEAAETATPATGTDSAALTLTPEGYGPLRIGMTRAEVEAALGPDSHPEAVGGPEPDVCDIFTPSRAPEELSVMVEDGILTRVSVSDDSTVVTDRGFGVGATAQAIKAAYGDAVSVEGHRYVEGGEYLTVWTGGRPTVPFVQDAAARGVRFETNEQDVVTTIHAGGPSIQYVEDCL